jgi:hypothetical protein
MLHAFAVWLNGTSLSWFVTHYPWVWPAAETLHFVGLSLLVGIAGLFDLRLIGFFRSLPIGPLHKMMRWAIAGFILNLATGFMFFAGDPFQYLDNVAFRYKMLFVALAGANAMLFEFVVSKQTLVVGAGQNAPTLARIIGAASLLSWLSVLYWGRMLAFIGNAF